MPQTSYILYYIICTKICIWLPFEWSNKWKKKNTDRLDKIWIGSTVGWINEFYDNSHYWNVRFLCDIWFHVCYRFKKKYEKKLSYVIRMGESYWEMHTRIIFDLWRRESSENRFFSFILYSLELKAHYAIVDCLYLL